MLIVAFFGVLGGLQSLTMISLCGNSRGLDTGVERLLLERQLQVAVEETILQQWERRHETPPPFREVLSGNLERLSCPGVVLTPELSPEAPQFLPDFLEGGASLSFAPPTEALLARCGPELRALCGVLVAEDPGRKLAVQAEGMPWAVSSSESLKVEYSVFRVPLSALGDLAYDLPDELGKSVAGSASLSVTGGLARERDPARREDLTGPGTGLPFHFRRRASLAASYARLFSKDSVESLARLAGPCLMHRLDLPERDTAQCVGLSRTPDGGSLDLAVAGQGGFGGRTSTGSLLVVASAKPGQLLRLYDSGSLVSSPLVVLVVGTGSLRLQLASCQRPVLLIASKVELLSEGGAWAGGLILGPGCRVLPGSGRLELSHFSHHAGDGAVFDSWFKVSLPVDPQLAGLSPSVVFVNSRLSSHDS
jgi:hypothetical protein